jgi:nucleoside-diphosphate-sugar epimerase
VLVTGSTGFIGSRLIQRLEASGVKVTGLSRAVGFDLLADALPLDGIDHVYHGGGLTYVPNAWSDPVSFHLVNGHGTVRVLDQCRRAGVSVTYLSAYVYGRPSALPIAEETPARPNNPYAFSKFAGEEACRFFADAFGADISILRLFNVYGPGQDPTFLIPTIARQVMDPDVAEIVVADLSPRRDFVHVDDVVDALLLAPGLPAGQVFNVGSGVSWSVDDVIRTCLSCAGIAKPYRGRGERRENEILDVVADVTAIGHACGWRPNTDFQSGIRSVMESVKS